MIRPSERLAALIPGVYHARDATIPGRPLARLLGTLGTGLDELATSVEGLWDDHFVERARPEALLLLADLLGAQLFTQDARVNRAVLARTVAWRRRKGTLPTLEEMLSVTSLWDAEVDEAFRSLMQTQDLRDPLPWRGRTTVLWDPIGLSDPLTRRSAGVDRPRDERTQRTPLLGLERGESLDAALRRLGRADAGRHAASPRQLDLTGWARPEIALIRTARLVDVELEEVQPARLHALTGGQLGLRVDPVDRDGPLVWLEPLVRADLTGGVTERHEPEPRPPLPPRTAAMVLTPTSLAADPDGVEAAGAISVHIDGIPLIGPDPVPSVPGPLPQAPASEPAVLRFADRSRPGPGDQWRLTLLAARTDADVTLLSSDHSAEGEGPVTVTAEARQLLNGHTVALTVERTAGEPRLMQPDGTWVTLEIGGRTGIPRSNLAVVDLAGTSWVYRVQRRFDGPTLELGRFDASDTGAPWKAQPLTGELPDDASGMTLVAAGLELLLIAPDGAGHLGVWRIRALSTAPSSDRIDAAGPRRPEARARPSACVFAGRLFLYGGEVQGTALGDLWSLPLAGGPWRPHPVRNHREQVGAGLIATEGGLVLLGGHSGGALVTDVVRCDPTAASVAWRPLPPLPVEAGRPGKLLHRVTATHIEALVWADRTEPLSLALPHGGTDWEPHLALVEAPRPPAEDTWASVGDRYVVVDPAPLPPSEVIFTMGGHGHLVFLPELTLLPGEAMRFHVARDGATYAESRPGQPLPLDVRFGGALHERFRARHAGDHRHTLPGRLSRHRYTIRQRSLGPWDQLPPAFVDEFVAVDPRLGRIVLPANAPRGEITLSARIGRGAVLGAGCLTTDRQLRPAWSEPDLVAPIPPDLRRGPDGRLPRPAAWVSPRRQGTLMPSHTGEVPVVGTVEAAMIHARGLAHLGIIGSPRLRPTFLSSGTDDGISLIAADAGAVPCFDADERGVSLSIAPGFGGRRDTDIWLAGLWLSGRLELSLARGAADIRWCNVGLPGMQGVRIPGGGHQETGARRSLPPIELELRLFGCMVSSLEVPPWVRVWAAGCTFDAGSRDEPAIRAAGATVRMRHCTIRGATEAGVLEASSSAFAGQVRVDRPDRGWLRYSLFARGGRPPPLHRSQAHTVSFISGQQTDPGYLVLAENNGPGALHASETGGVPGAHGERSDQERELLARTDLALPVGMAPFHVDRTVEDLTRMSRT